MKTVSSATKLLTLIKRDLEKLTEAELRTLRRELRQLEQNLNAETSEVRSAVRAGKVSEAALKGLRNAKPFADEALRVGRHILDALNRQSRYVLTHAQMTSVLQRFNNLRESLGVLADFDAKAADLLADQYRRLHRQSHHIIEDAVSQEPHLHPLLEAFTKETAHLSAITAPWKFTDAAQMPAIALWADVHSAAQAELVHKVLDIRHFSTDLHKAVKPTLTAKKPSMVAIVEAHTKFYSNVLPLYDQVPIPNMRGSLADLMADLLAAAHRVDSSI